MAPFNEKRENTTTGSDIFNKFIEQIFCDADQHLILKPPVLEPGGSWPSSGRHGLSSEPETVWHGSTWGSTTQLAMFPCLFFPFKQIRCRYSKTCIFLLPLLLDFSGRLLFMHRVLANGSMSFFVHFLNLNKEAINKLWVKRSCGTFRFYALAHWSAFKIPVKYVLWQHKVTEVLHTSGQLVILL